MLIHNKNRKLKQPLSNRQQGLAMVEMVIVTPLLLFLILGVAELGRAFYQYNTLTKSVRNAAQYLANNSILGSTDGIPSTFPGADDGDIQTMTKYLIIYGIPETGTSLLEGFQIDANNYLTTNVIRIDSQYLQVTATYIYQPMFGGSIPNFGMGTGGIDNTYFTLTASSVMRALQ